MLLETSLLLVGVKVPVQVMLSLLAIVESEPLGALMSAELGRDLRTYSMMSELDMRAQ